MLIVIEGIDKSGKGTHSKRLAKDLGTATKLFSFPRYETTVGRIIKGHLGGQWKVAMKRLSDEMLLRQNGYLHASDRYFNAMVFQCLMLADKAEAGIEIAKRQAAEKNTVCDRYWQSAICYGGADGLDEDWLYSLNRLLPRPDLNILIDTPVDVALARGRSGRPDKPDRYERDKVRLQDVRGRYLKLWHAADSKKAAWIRIDGTMDIDKVYDAILKAARKY